MSSVAFNVNKAQRRYSWDLNLTVLMLRLLHSLLLLSASLSDECPELTLLQQTWMGFTVSFRLVPCSFALGFTALFLM